MLTIERAKQKLFWGGLVAFDFIEGYGVFEYSLKENKLYLTFINDITGYSRVYIYDIDEFDDLVKEWGIELYEVKRDGKFLKKVE